MTNIDQFESVFKSASKPVFHADPFKVSTVLVVTDTDIDRTESFCKQVSACLAKAPAIVDEKWDLVLGDGFANVSDLLAKVDRVKPDLICTYRNLHARAVEHPYSLGTYVDVLLQTTQAPVLLMPRPDRTSAIATTQATNAVMAITDHLAGDAHLVSVAAAMTDPAGSLHLTHIEDKGVFERYIDVISKIPTIDTEVAREDILQQLLKEPSDYINSCRAELGELMPGLTIHDHVHVGHHLNDYKRLVSEFEIDLLVLNTKDEDQLAMHGLAYPLTVELRDQAMLLL